MMLSDRRSEGGFYAPRGVMEDERAAPRCGPLALLPGYYLSLGGRSCTAAKPVMAWGPRPIEPSLLLSPLRTFTR
jgi:hypothetical protein